MPLYQYPLFSCRYMTHGDREQETSTASNVKSSRCGDLQQTPAVVDAEFTLAPTTGRNAGDQEEQWDASGG
jgi:hypothetical protein